MSSCFLRARGLKDEHGNEVHKFDHPWFQTGLMFIGKTKNKGNKGNKIKYIYTISLEHKKNC